MDIVTKHTEPGKEWFELPNGRKHGMETNWNEAGMINMKQMWDKGRRREVSIWWDNGNLKYINHYKGGKLNGLEQDWYETGELQAECFYKDDEDIEMRIWYPSYENLNYQNIKFVGIRGPNGQEESRWDEAGRRVK